MSEECGKIIRQVEESGEHQTKSKGINNPVTVADLRVQKTLEVCLNALYPTLRVQGEESKESIENMESAVDPATITPEVKNYIKTAFLNEKHSARREWIRTVLRGYYGEDEV